jgi:hypothetical protein
MGDAMSASSADRRQISGRSTWGQATALVLFGVLFQMAMTKLALAEQFSVKCMSYTFVYYVTFDTERKRAVYEIEQGEVKKGPITAAEASEIHFDLLTVGGPNVKLIWNERAKTVTWAGVRSGEPQLLAPQLHTPEPQLQSTEACRRIRLRLVLSNYDRIAPRASPWEAPAR